MILVTVGTAVFPFYRMSTLVTHLSHIRSPREPIVFQHGHTPVHFLEQNITAIQFMPHTELKRLMKRARIIVCHGGPATIFQALSAGIIPKVLPRKKWYGEHLTDHQADFTDIMEKKGLVRTITDKTPLPEILETARLPSVRLRENRTLIRYLDSLLHAHEPAPSEAQA